MTEPKRDLGELLQGLNPVLHDGMYVFTVVEAQHNIAGLRPLATIHEPEGLTLILTEAAAAEAGLETEFQAAWISLSVHSDLAAIGLTAAVSVALADAGISCNVVAGAFHDHLFVPVDRAQEAMKALLALQASAQGTV